MPPVVPLGAQSSETPAQGIYLWGTLLHMSLLWQTYLAEYILLSAVRSMPAAVGVNAHKGPHSQVRREEV